VKLGSDYGHLAVWDRQEPIRHEIAGEEVCSFLKTRLFSQRLSDETSPSFFILRSIKNETAFHSKATLLVTFFTEKIYKTHFNSTILSFIIFKYV
jgi:hypothetical protein